MWFKSVRVLVMACTALLGMGQAQAQTKGCAMVLMHGKWSSPNNLAVFARNMDAVCDTTLIEMPWSRRRNYDQPYPVAVAEIGAQVKALRDKGYARVLVAGHSFGANGALAYMAQVGDADGVIALAPGHSPETIYRRGTNRAAVEQARALVADGRGADTLDMEDLNVGKTRVIPMRADVLLSYFEPKGWGNFPLSTSRFRKAVPLLWVVGTGDHYFEAGPAMAFDKAPPHPASQYLVVEADHQATPAAATAPVIEWIKALP